ncbi:MAG: pilus assembly protein PilM [Verrucomicrobiota bacterium]
MAKSPTQVIGVDFGRYAIKSVLLSKRGGKRFLLNGYAIRTLDTEVETPEQITRQIQQLFKEMGGSVQNCAVAVSCSDAVIRIIEQPETPTEMLREALRLNGMALLNQDVKEFVLDCDLIKSASAKEGARQEGQRQSYLVGGLPRALISKIDAGFQKVKKKCIKSVQLPPVCAFNAFEFACPEVFNNEAFMLVDIGHASSTLIVGVKGELILVRSIEFCGKLLLNALSSHAESTPAEALKALATGDNPLVIETARLMLTALTREISSSIGFFEGRREETISRIYVSGGLARYKTVLDIINEDLHMPCKTWDPLNNCEIALPANRRQTLAEDGVCLAVASGAALEILKGK